MDPIKATMKIAGSALQAQATRLRVVAENMANANSTASTPGADPYRRKTIVFAQEMDRAAGVELVSVKKIGTDRSDFGLTYDPSHPAANADGYVKTPNVKSLIEMMDMRETTRSYEANLNVIEQARTILRSTLDLIRNT